MEIRKIIFLDFDGVIVTASSQFNRFDRSCMEHLTHIIDKTDANIVISSSWRIGNGFRALRAMFDGFGLFHRVIGVTPMLNGNMIRGQEIDAWIKNPLLSSKLELNLKSFVILDDDSDMEPHMDRLVLVPTDTGLTEKEADEAFNHYIDKRKMDRSKIKSVQESIKFYMKKHVDK